MLLAKIPLIDEWEVLRSGAVKGTISNHPTLPDGYEITTSPLDEKKSVLKNNSLVTTASGSKYRLLLQEPKQAKAAAKIAASKKTKPAKPKPVKAKPLAKPKPVVAKKQAPTVDYNLNGKVVGSGGKNEDVYLLVGNLIRSSSKRSQIYYAYKADKDGNPSGAKLTIKLTGSVERLSRENKNYNRVFSKGRVLFSLQGSGSCYVKKVAFCPSIDTSPSTTGIPKGNSALVLESGDKNLRAFLTDSKKGLTGGELRTAAVNVARCVEAMHSSGLVWTDLKAENFVLVGSGANQEVKGIDLESAVPVKTCPEDYSPEASPPEFAASEKAGVGYEFQVNKNYDIWSLGMLFYELSTGKNYFAGQGEGAILTRLATPSKIIDAQDQETVPGLDAIEDDRFRDLVRSCLSIDPKKRPSIEQVLFHPYFLTTGIGPLSF